ncbi:MAG: single-stranded-DNA-specific exonuclease RecJ [Selenomonadaceae bacterium]|nr:single-stranded-DNA-specific exonuclease RecJ [Selenomonadaceae bacterium]MDY3915863.1 single-stranded-DNA-specific exonuclease RecJ [Selenomonadaceae bacterium]
MRKEWRVEPQAAEAAALAQAVGVSPLVANMLVQRGVRTAAEAQAFLHPETQPFHDALLLPDMAKAVARIAAAIQGGERIVIYGDYDVDGITATTLMLRNLHALGAQADYYIPDRSEGYGFNEKALKELAADYDLLVSVDCGIASVELVDAVKDKMDFVITDHHLPGETLPPAVAVVNPHRADSGYPCADLCGCGVAFKLCQALWREMRGQDYAGELELVALGTVADVVPLQGENRKIVSMGLKALRQTELPGLQALLQVCKLEGADQPLHSSDIGFRLGPRLNSAGRMRSARLGVELLMSETLEEALPLAEQLNELNAKRQEVEQDICAQAEAQLATEDVDALSAIVVAGEDWHPGVIGIVGSRLVEQYYKPVIVCSIRKDGTCKGSCRSIEGLHMYEALRACKDDLLQFGGHAQAAGLSLQVDKLDDLRRDFCAYAKEHLKPEDYVPRVRIEAELAPEDITEELIGEVALLEPFGEGNPQPAFGVRQIQGWGARAIGKGGEHLRFNVGSQSGRIAVLFWRHSELVSTVNNEALDIVYEPQINEWNGQRSIQLMAQSVEPAQSERIFPTREILAGIYRMLSQLQHQTGAIGYTAGELATMHSQRYGHISTYTLELGLRIFLELGLLQPGQEGKGWFLPPATKRMNLMDSPTYHRHFAANDD